FYYEWVRNAFKYYLKRHGPEQFYDVFKIYHLRLVCIYIYIYIYIYFLQFNSQILEHENLSSKIINFMFLFIFTI
ncbi:hypothetical protein ACMBCM_09090, partial [Spiroplasma sp. K1]